MKAHSRHHPLRAALQRWAGAALLALAAPQLASAQLGNDDVGVVPGATGLIFEGGHQPTPTGGNTPQSAQAHLTVAAELMITPLDETRAVLSVETEAELASGDEPAAATLASSEPLAVQLPGDDGQLALQGDAMLQLHEVVESAHLQAPAAAIARATVLVLDDGVTLEALLSGAAQPLHVEILPGAPTSIDLALLHRKVTQIGEQLGSHEPLGVSWVFVSVDASGQRHLAAARAFTDGRPLEIAVP